jgi:hypothetical protein
VVAVLRGMEFDMLPPAWGLCLVLCASVAFAQTPTPKPIESFIRLECHGKLRHGVVAIGGETTGTTIEFDGMKWELKLPDDASRRFAKDHHKQPITVEGSLRVVRGTEIPVRYIVDVEKLSLRNAATQKEGACLKVWGTLRTKDAAAGEPPGMAIVADGITWPLDFSADPAIKVRAESLVGKSVVLVGQLERGAEAKCPPRPIIRVNKLDASTGKTIPK